jgi:hypothetical protein
VHGVLYNPRGLLTLVCRPASSRASLIFLLAGRVVNSRDLGGKPAPAARVRQKRAMMACTGITART